MIKVISCWRDNPSLSAEQNEANYRNGHMDMARRMFDGVDGFQALVYNRVKRHFVYNFNTPPTVECESDMDAYVELYFRDQDSMDKAFARPELQALFEDHVNFMDTKVPASIRGYDLDEDVYLGTRPG